MIKIVANATSDTAYVYVNGVKIGNAIKIGTAATIDGFSFGSGGTAPTGDQALMDDIDLYDTPTIPGMAMIRLSAPTDTISSIAVGKDSALIKKTMLAEPAKGKFSILISPNPANGSVKLSVKNTTNGPINVFVTDMRGVTKKKMNDADTNPIIIPIQDLAVGTYIITAQQSGQTAQTKLIVN